MTTDTTTSHVLGEATLAEFAQGLRGELVTYTGPEAATGRMIKVSDATMQRIRKLLPLDQTIELIGTIAGYNMVSRFLVVLGIDAAGE